MVRILFVLVMMLVASPVVAQDIKVITWSEFLQGIETTSAGFVHKGRDTAEYTVVTLPAGVMTLGPMYKVSDAEGSSLNLAILQRGPVVDVRNMDGTTQKFVGSVRLMYYCSSIEVSKCREDLTALLRQGMMLQGTGVEQGLSSKDSELPELKLTFYTNPTGRFKF